MENDKNMFIIEYEMFDPNTLTTGIIMINITTAQFEFSL